MNEPYDPEGDAVRGRNWEFLSPAMKERLRERLKGSPFENADLDSLKIHVGETPWYMPSDKGGITLEDHIYIDTSRMKNGFRPLDDENHLSLLTEEVIHTDQYKNGMTRPGYLWEAAKHGYERNPYEIAAQSVAWPGYEAPAQLERVAPPTKEEWQQR
ncbi:hypothetical protein [Fundidesulfovibrio agrisoli]|uniref:hypothetical protein n=1 Tax=Fundidesulfovibrio agrisoli TaxID=2922717 RepID=UPI001FAB7E83|nr:hypothetical protein [Fundidesulfovibrio agrisoli]